MTRTAATSASDGLPGPIDALNGPRPIRERILVLDAVRGLALLGILVVNAMLFLWPVYGVPLGLPEAATAIDRAAQWLVTFAFEGKFFTIFSLLFGIGIAMQLDRGHAPSLIARRLLLLVVIGALHISLLWWGDILLYYAILGFALLMARRWSLRRLVRSALVLFAVPVVLQVLVAVLVSLPGGAPQGGEGVQATADRSLAMFEAGYAAAVTAYAGTDPGAMLAQRWADWGFSVIGLLFSGMIFVIVGMFLLGAAAYRSGWTGPEARDRWRWTFVRALPIAVIANLVYAWPGLGTDSALGGWMTVVSTLAFVIGGPSGALAIASGAALVLRGVGPLPTGLAAAGRLALSTYLTQSIVFTTLAYGYGLGLYERVTHAQALGLALLLFALQVPLAVLWTRRFAFGPIEWLWRALTYGRRPTARAG